ncbi:hypothetical protein Agabi119p4_2434 [Agaricus bisporus var. burnettii]|uniref:GPI mannosyltransferase 2 n=1 Tax=Agaricus bisporus var. burnettii TaxID=192524 RepID=A0A8H7F962_AGABI|nr:hypothetical protein Agabi119p4_2434 [Agaricus bisporus var. burnettii]
MASLSAGTSSTFSTSPATATAGSTTMPFSSLGPFSSASSAIPPSSSSSTPPSPTTPALLALIPSSPATLYWAPYAEPFFTYLSYRGMFASARRQWLKATLFFTLAATFRSNGFFLAGFIIWPCFLLKPSLSTLAISVLSTVLILSPILAHNFAAYLSFCPSSSPPPGARIPFLLSTATSNPSTGTSVSSNTGPSLSFPTFSSLFLFSSPCSPTL